MCLNLANFEAVNAVADMYVYDTFDYGIAN